MWSCVGSRKRRDVASRQERRALAALSRNEHARVPSGVERPAQDSDARRPAATGRFPSRRLSGPSAKRSRWRREFDGFHHEFRRLHAAPAAESAAKDRELERLTKKLAFTEYELDTVRGILARRASERRADGSAGSLAPNEAVSTPQVPISPAVPLKRPSARGK